MVTVTADRPDEPIGRLLGHDGADHPGAAVHLEPAHVGAIREDRAVAPQPAEAFAVLQGRGRGKPRAVERQVAVAGHAIEKGGVAELGPVETGDAKKLGIREGRATAKSRRIEAGIAEKTGLGEARCRIEGAVDEPGEALELNAAQRDRGVEGRAGEVEMRERGAFELERLLDDEPAQILDLAPSQRMRELCQHGIHALPAAPAGGPAKDSANRPIACMSTSTICGPRASKARSSAAGKCSTRDTFSCCRPSAAASSLKSGVCRSA